MCVCGALAGRCVWEEMATTGEAAVARNAHTASVVDSKMYVFGGSNVDGPMADVSVLDLSTFFNITLLPTQNTCSDPK
jgi:hypothetical protein